MGDKSLRSFPPSKDMPSNPHATHPMPGQTHRIGSTDTLTPDHTRADPSVERGKALSDGYQSRSVQSMTRPEPSGETREQTIQRAVAEFQARGGPGSGPRKGGGKAGFDANRPGQGGSGKGGRFNAADKKAITDKHNAGLKKAATEQAKTGKGNLAAFKNGKMVTGKAAAKIHLANLSKK